MSDMTDVIKGVLPTIATALGGPLAGIAAKFVTDKLGLPADSVQNVTAILSGMSPDKLAELKLHDQELQVKLAELGYHNVEAIAELNIRALEAINKTMQVEAGSEHWPTYSWRPYNGFMFGTTIFGCYFVLPLLKLPVPVVPEWVWMAWGAILGVASWYRGKMQADPSVPTNNKG